MTRLHPRSAMHIVDFDGPRFGPVIATGIENPHSPCPQIFAPPLWRVSLEPVQSCGSQAAQPVVRLNRLGQLPLRLSQSLLQTSPVKGKHCAERQFEWGTRARPGSRTSIRLGRTALPGPRLAATVSRNSCTLLVEAISSFTPPAYRWCLPRGG